MPSFCLIGEDSLLIQCGNELLQRNHQITWVISPLEEIQAWAESQKLPWKSSLEEWLKKSPSTVDYIFSIVNSFILNNNVLKIARKGVINYHDSLLPKYAGLNATTWSIFYGEQLHGVSWHWVDLGIDTGALVKQFTFPVTKEETALSLNLKCYEAAIHAFKELLTDIENNKISISQQDEKKRSYFGHNHVLPGAGFLHWPHYNAQFISQISRATTLGNYKNHIGLLKLILKDKCFIIPRKVQVLEREKSAAEPGTILALDNKKIKVATLTHPVVLEDFISPTGKEVQWDKVIKDNGWNAGQKLLSPQPQHTENWRFFYALALKNESWWVKEIKKMTEHTTFTLVNKSASENAEKLFTLEFHADMQSNFSFMHLVFTTLLIYLFRLNNYESTSVFLYAPPDKTLEPDYRTLFSSLLPFSVNWQANQTLAELTYHIKAQLDDYEQKKTYLTDVIARYPELNYASQNGLIINLSGIKIPKDILMQALLYFELNPKKKTLSVYHGLNLNAQGQLLQSIIRNTKEHLQNIFNQLTHNPHVLISEFCFLPEKERLLLTNKWGKGQSAAIPNQTISALFEEQVSKQGQKTALIAADGQKTTFNELSQIVNRLCYAIQKLQLPPQTLIGVYLQRGVPLIANLLAILKANCVYVPLDIKSPLIKIEHIAKEARLEWIISTKEQCSLLNKHFKKKQFIHCFDWESLIKTPFDEKRLKPHEKKSTNQLTYIMFTSGSTGAPKGVVVNQTNIINYCTWFIKTTDFNSHSIVDFSSSIAFDLSVPCTLAPLIAGGSIALCDEQTKANPSAYLKHLKKNGVTHVELIPSYLELLLAHPQLIKKLTELKVVLLGADTLHLTETLQWLSLCPHHQMINEYGPTETTVAITSYPIRIEELNQEMASIPIGRPAYNALAFVLDKHLNLCPIGMKGHLHISGPQVTNGYYFKPHLTQKKFVSLALCNKTEVFYNTGDLTAWLPQGQLQFFGRDDFQVKMHGYRIELIEIESTLMRMPNIHQAVVLVVTPSSGDKFLRAYLVLEKKTPPSLTKIKEFLADYLPFYMMPKEFCLINKVPVRDNEKIDLNALEKMPYQLLNFDYEINETLNTWEQNLMKIWQQIFNTTQINSTDDFFELGGNSLIALHIISEIKTLYNISIPLGTLFEYPNIQKLAHYLEKPTKNAEKKSSPVILLSQGKHPIPLFLIHPVGGSIFWYQPLADSLRGYFTVYGIQDPNFMGESMPFHSLEDMASYYIEAIKEIHPGPQFALGGASFGATVALEMTRQLQKQQNQVSYLALFDGWAKYPEKIMEKNTAHLLSQDEAKFLSLEQKKEFYQLEQWRKSLLLNYKIPEVAVNATLFKAIELWEGFKDSNQPQNGWSSYLHGQLTTHLVPGNHETMMFHPNIQHLAQRIKKELFNR